MNMDKKILIVDDEPAIRKFLVNAFSKQGYDVISAESAEEALGILDEENIQVLFLDLRLPGMNGTELCRQIRKDNAIACIYAMTGFGSLFELSDCRDAGFDDYFLKPVDLEIFLKTAEDSFSKLERWKKKTP